MIIFGLGLLMAAYCVGHNQINLRPTKAKIGTRQFLFFLAGWFILASALLPPFADFAERIFSLHMTQHMILMFAVAPLMIMGRPGAVISWSLTPNGLRFVNQLRRKSVIAGAVQFCRSPLTIWVAFNAVFLFWHAPWPYNLSLSSGPVHALEHLSLLLISSAFWSVVAEPSGVRRMGDGLTAIFVATTAVVSSLPGALMVLAITPFYASDEQLLASFGLSRLEDQQLAGLLMWIPGGFAFVGAIVVLVAIWLRDAERNSRRTKYFVRAACIWGVATVLEAIYPAPARAQEEAKVPADAPQLIHQYGCGTCHEIPGVRGAIGTVGPPLTKLGRRIYLAGVLRNTQENLEAWLLDPQRFVRGNAMPNVGLKPDEARAIANYLSSLR